MPLSKVPANIRSAVVSAVPTAAPTKFAIGFSANLENDPNIYLKNTINSTITNDIKEAAACSLEGSKLKCEGITMGAKVALGPGNTDMAPLEKVDDHTEPNSIDTGFTLDSKNVLHWKNDEKFSKLMGWKSMEHDSTIFPNLEARFALFKYKGTGDPRFYTNLGCTNPDHLAYHGNLNMGFAKAVAL